MRDRIFYAICFGFIFGVLLRSFFFVNLYFSIFIGLLSFVLILFFTLISKDKWPARPPDWSGAGGGIAVSIFILAFSLGILRFHFTDVSAPNVFSARGGPASGWESNKVELTGIIIDEPDIRENNQRLTIELSRLNLDNKVEKTKILATVDFGEDFKYGDEVKFDGKLEKPENFITDQGKEFDYINYLRKDGIFYVINYANVEIISRDHGNKIKSTLFFIKNKFLGKMNLAISHPGSLLMGGLILGERSSFNSEMREKFIHTGTIHIARALLLAGVIMIALNPFLLRYDVSFQLSFIATVAIIFLVPRFEKHFLWVTPKFGLRDVVTVTFCAYIFVLPFILYKMGNLSLVALPANVLILPFIPLTMMLGFLTGFAGLVWYGFGVPLGYISYLFLHYELGVINFFSNLPFTSFSIPNFPLVITIAIYAYFIYKLFGRNIKDFFIERL